MEKANSTNQKSKPVTRIQTAKFFHVSVRTIDTWTQLGYLTATKIGRRVYYNESELIRLIESNK